MPFVAGFLRVLHRRDRPDRPVDPDWGVEGPEAGGDERPDQGGPSPGRPSHGLPWPGFPARPGHGLPPSWGGLPIDPGWGVEGPEIPGLPEIPEQGPVVPGRPGHPLPRPPVPVVKACPLPEGEELPEGRPHEPGCFVIVVEGKSNRKALGWLQGVAALPDIPHDADAAPGQPLPGGPAPGQPLPRPPASRLGGHWVAVDADPLHACEGEGDCCFAFVFEVTADFGKR